MEYISKQQLINNEGFVYSNLDKDQLCKLLYSDVTHGTLCEILNRNYINVSEVEKELRNIWAKQPEPKKKATQFTDVEIGRFAEIATDERPTTIECIGFYMGYKKGFKDCQEILKDKNNV